MAELGSVSYLFQKVGSAVEIESQPQSTAGCEGSTVEFEVNATSQSGSIEYQWQFYNTTTELWDDLSDTGSYSGTETEKLTINPNNPDQYKEIKSIRWLNRDECLQKVRCYSISKRNLIQEFFSFL